MEKKESGIAECLSILACKGQLSHEILVAISRIKSFL